MCVFLSCGKSMVSKLRLQRWAKRGHIKQKLYIYYYSPKNWKYEHWALMTWKQDHAVKHHGYHSNSSEAQLLNQTREQLLSAGCESGQEGAVTLWLALKTPSGALLVCLKFYLDMMIKRHTFKNYLHDLWCVSLHFDHCGASRGSGNPVWKPQISTPSGFCMMFGGFFSASIKWDRVWINYA